MDETVPLELNPAIASYIQGAHAIADPKATTDWDVWAEAILVKAALQVYQGQEVARAQALLKESN